MRRLLLATALTLGALPAIAGIDETWQRPGSEGWGRNFAAKAGMPGFGRSIAVVIGVGAYSNGWPPLEAPPRDAARMRDFLKDEAGFDVVHTLTDERATRDRIRRLMLNDLPREVGPNDRVIVYFSGHGTQRELYGGRTVGYLALAESAQDDYASMIEMSDVERWWRSMAQAKQSLFILDACFSGLGLQSKSNLKTRTIRELSRRGHHLVTAGTADQESYASLSRWGGSLFTTALLDGMRGRADSANADAPEDGIVSLKELWDYVEKRVRADLPERVMTPQLASFEFSNDGEFFFVADPEAARTPTGNGVPEDKGTGSRPLVGGAAGAILGNPIGSQNGPGQPDSSGFPRGFTISPLARAMIGKGNTDNDPSQSLAEKRYRESLIISNSQAEKIRLLKLALAADENYVPALRDLAGIYLSGDGFAESDPDTALKLYIRCADRGDEFCRTKVLDLMHRGAMNAIQNIRP